MPALPCRRAAVHAQRGGRRRRSSPSSWTPRGAPTPGCSSPGACCAQHAHRTCLRAGDTLHARTCGADARVQHGAGTEAAVHWTRHPPPGIVLSRLQCCRTKGSHTGAPHSLNPAPPPCMPAVQRPRPRAAPWARVRSAGAAGSGAWLWHRRRRAVAMLCTACTVPAWRSDQRCASRQGQQQRCTTSTCITLWPWGWGQPCAR